MASTNFVDNSSVIYASWLNNVNEAVYNGNFQATTISPVNLVCNGSVSGTGFNGLVNSALGSPAAIGNGTPNTGAFTTLSATTLTLTNALNRAYGGTGLTTAGANGNVLTSNGTNWISAAATGRLINVQSFSSSTTYTATTGTSFIIVEVVGGGGGGAQPGNPNGGGGGGAGGYSRKKITSGFDGTSVTVGTGGAVNGAGNPSSFGAFATSTGGVANSGVGGGVGGVGSGGDFNFRGSGGSGGSSSYVASGSGGAGYNGYGGGAAAGGTGYAGTGGGGGGAYPTGAAGVGGSGIVIVYEYA